MIPKLSAALEFHGQALVLRAERQRLIASNIANADTPGYQARDFDFAGALRAATGSAAPGSDIAAAVMRAGGRAEPLLRHALAAQANLDGNTVDMDRERATFADNTLKYESTLRFISGSVRTLLDAMKSHHSS